MLRLTYETTSGPTELTGLDISKTGIRNFLAGSVNTTKVLFTDGPTFYGIDNKGYSTQTLETGVSIPTKALRDEDYVKAVLVDLLETLECRIVYLQAIEFRPTKSAYHKQIVLKLSMSDAYNAVYF